MKIFVLSLLIVTGFLTACDNGDDKKLENGSNDKAVDEVEEIVSHFDLLATFENAEIIHPNQYENPHERVSSYAYFATAEAEDIVAFYYDIVDNSAWELTNHGTLYNNHTVWLEQVNFLVILRIREMSPEPPDTYNHSVEIEIREQLIPPEQDDS